MHLVARVILLNIVNVLSLSASTLVQQTHYNEKDYKCFASLIVYNVHQVCMFYNKVV